MALDQDIEVGTTGRGGSCREYRRFRGAEARRRLHKDEDLP